MNPWGLLPDNLAETWGRRVRNLTAENATVLDAKLAADSQAAGRWMLEGGSEYFAAGVGAAIVGFRANGAIIDDPVRGQEDADSELTRNRTWEWFQSDLTTRLKPGGFIVLVQTRWHEDDLAGQVLARMASGGEQWDVVSLPAVAEADDPLGRAPGEYLWADDGYGYADDLREKRKNFSARAWAALFQQRPAPEQGDFFKREYFRPYTKAPPRNEMTTFGASDYAVSAGKGDYTCHIVVGLDYRGNMFLLDLWRAQTRPLRPWPSQCPRAGARAAGSFRTRQTRRACRGSTYPRPCWCRSAAQSLSRQRPAPSRRARCPADPRCSERAGQCA